MPEFDVRRELPAYQTTAVALLPQQAGRFAFACGPHRLRSSLVVKQGPNPGSFPPYSRPHNGDGFPPRTAGACAPR